ncbi:hypothetical protein ASE00_11760 [Sphingomonas sp. Root710]|nr:hypothetical protein ASE00_11760 [Sphingomonas sp. Root710]
MPIGGIRRMIARKMMDSLASTAQLSFTTRVDATALVATRAAWKQAGVPAGYEDLLLTAVRDTLLEYPRFNAVSTADAVHIYDEICVSVAVALDDSLVAPAMPDLRGMKLPEIVELRRALVARARANKLTLSEMSFGTFTISNIGTTRVDHFTPILNGGQVAILGIGRITPALHLGEDGGVASRPELALSLTTDHRVIDGAPSGAFLTSLAERIEGALPQVEGAL